MEYEMSKETEKTYHGKGVVTERTTVTKADGSGKTTSHTYKDGFIFQDTISRSEKTFGPSTKK